MLTRIVYWESWHRSVGIAAYKMLVDGHGPSFRMSQPVAEVVLVSVLCVSRLPVARTVRIP
jgi:hypothetical protein